MATTQAVKPKATTSAVPSVALKEAKAQLPAVITETFAQTGDLIDSQDFTDAMWKQAEEIAAKFNIRDSAARLNFGAKTQRQASAYMDKLLGDLRVGESGAAGDLLNQITSGVQLMNLRQVRDQIANPPGFLKKLFAWTDYVKAFYENHKTVVSKFEQIERQADNLVQNMSRELQKLDNLVDSTVDQVNELRILIAAGEIILAEAIEEYEAERDEVLGANSPDTLKLSKLLDFQASIRSFETRMLRIKTAFVEAASTSIPQIRLIQESTTIAIQNVNEAVLFDMTSIKRAILKLAALKTLKEANTLSREYSKMSADVQDVLAETTLDTHRESVKSQGDALARAEGLQNLVSKMIEGAKLSQEAADEAVEQQRQAHEILLETKRSMDEAMAESARDAA